MRKVGVVTIVNISAKKLNLKLTKVLRTRAGELGYTVDSVYRMYFNQFYHFYHRASYPSISLRKMVFWPWMSCVNRQNERIVNILRVVQKFMLLVFAFLFLL